MEMRGGAEVQHITLLTSALDVGGVSLKFQPWAPETVWTQWPTANRTPLVQPAASMSTDFFSSANVRWIHDDSSQAWWAMFLLCLYLRRDERCYCCVYISEVMSDVTAVFISQTWWAMLLLCLYLRRDERCYCCVYMSGNQAHIST
jgi:hypothetical protein